MRSVWTLMIIGISSLVLLNGKLIASQVIWDGSTNTSWEISSNWNTNVVPTAADSVFIPTGFTVNLTALVISEALHVRIESGSSVNIPLTSTLQVENSPGHGVENAGTIVCFGTISIMSTGGIGLWAGGSSSTQVELASSLFVENAGTNGIVNLGNFVNQGSITIEDSGNIGLVNENDFSNQGLLNIWQSQTVGLLNRDSLYNGLLHTIDILNPVGISIGMHNEYGTVENLGGITIESLGSGTGLLNEGYFSTNLLTILNTSLALQNSSLVGSFWSHGLTTVSICTDGILNRSLFTVHVTSTVTISLCSNVPLECGMYATFDNMGLLTILP